MSDSTPRVRTYGNWRKPQKGGLGKLSYAATISGLAFILGLFLIQNIYGWTWAALFLATGGPAWVLVAREDRHGVTAAYRLGEYMRFSKSNRKGENLYRSGLLAINPTDGKTHLPGTLAATTISEHADAYGRPFALLHHADKTMSVVASLAPPGTDLIDSDKIDDAVGHWAAWLGYLSTESGLIAAQLTIESVPDNGKRLRREIENTLTPDAPDLAKAAMREVLVNYSVGLAMVRGWVSFTFEPTKLGGSAKRRFAAAEIGARLPNLTRGLEGGTRAGAVHLMTATDLTRMVRIAYDPAAEPLFDDADAKGTPIQLTWGEAGPLVAEAQKLSYYHDSGHSKSWVMTSPPSGEVQSGVLRRLLEPNRDVERKRVTLFYQPISPALAGDLVEKDIKQAQLRATSTGKPSHRAAKEHASATQTAREEASGAALVDFGMIVTATTTSGDPDHLATVIEALTAASRLQMRPAYGVQDSAFALSLPLGIQPSTGTSLGAAKW